MTRQFVKNKWEPKDYLVHYYSSDKLVYDEALLFEYVYKFLARFKKNSFTDFLDFGSGPIIHRLIPFVNYAKNIYAADYLQENLNEIKLWLKSNANAYDWDKQIEHILKIEYQNQKKSFINVKKKIQVRESILRKKVRALVRCDAFKKDPLLGFKKKFDIITSFYCIDSITSSKREWEEATRNLLGLIKPGGWVIIAALIDTKHYMVNDIMFPSPNIHKEDFLKVFTRGGFDLKSVDVKMISAKHWSDSGIKSLIIVSAQKLKHETFSR